MAKRRRYGNRRPQHSRRLWAGTPPSGSSRRRPVTFWSVPPLDELLERIEHTRTAAATASRNCSLSVNQSGAATIGLVSVPTRRA
jgi:hypothetical protein